MRLAIIGSGSLGSLFAAYLSSEIDLTLIGHWPEQMTTLRDSGLTMIHLDGHQSHHLFPVSLKPANEPSVDFVLVLVKSYQTLRAAQDAKSILSPNGLAVTLQNGLGNKEILASVLGSTRVAQGVTSLGANMVEPGIVRHAGKGNVFIAAPADKKSYLDHLAKWLNDSGLKTELTADVDSLIWGKLVVNAGINPLSALLRVPNGYLATNEIACRLMYDAAEETAAVATSLGIKLPFPSPGKRVVEVARLTAQNYSSMLQDILRSAPTEIDAICGQIIRQGRQNGVPTPINDEFFRLIIEYQNTHFAKHPISELKPLQSLLSQQESLQNYNVQE